MATTGMSYVLNIIVVCVKTFLHIPELFLLLFLMQCFYFGFPLISVQLLLHLQPLTKIFRQVHFLAILQSWQTASTLVLSAAAGLQEYYFFSHMWVR